MQLQKKPADLCKEVIRKDLQNMIVNALLERFAKRLEKDEEITVQGFTGFESGLLIIKIGSAKKTHRFEFFTENLRGDELDGAIGLLVDYADSALEEFFRFKRNRHFPIDYIRREFDGHPVYARHELTNPAAEKMADDLLKKS